MQTEERYHAGELHGQLCRAFAGCPKTLLDGNHSDVRPHPAVLFMQQQTQPARAEIYPARHPRKLLVQNRPISGFYAEAPHVCVSWWSSITNPAIRWLFWLSSFDRSLAIPKTFQHAAARAVLLYRRGRVDGMVLRALDSRRAGKTHL